MVLKNTAQPRAVKCRQRTETAMNRTAAYLVSTAMCGRLLAASPAWAQAMDGHGDLSTNEPALASQKVTTNPAVDRQHRRRGQQYASDSYHYGYFCLTYPTYPTPTSPSVFSGDYGCPSRNIYHANLRTAGLVIPGAPGAYDLYYYDWTDPLDHVTAPFVVLTWPIKALSTPVAEAETATAPLVTSRSVATGHMGSICATPVKTCELSHASYVGNGCSCRVPGGSARGSVSP
jgi:hypothetical protein